MPQVDFNRIATNIAGLQSLNALSDVNSKLAVHRMRLASGRRINEAADDPAGLSIATKFRARSEGLGQALANIGDAKSLLAVSEGGLQKISDILVQMQKKATQAASDTLGTTERAAIKQDLEAFNAEIDRIVAETQWNGQKLLDGSVVAGVSSLKFQTGSEAGEVTEFGFSAASAQFTAASLSVTVGTAASSVSAYGTLPTTVKSVATEAVRNVEGASEFNTGRYRISVTKSGDTATVELRDVAGNLQQFYDGTDALVTSMTVAYTVGNDAVIDLGRGIKFTLDGAAHGTFQPTNFDVDYTRSGHSVDSNTNASTFLTSVQSAISKVSEGLQSIGSLTARLQFKEENVTIARTNVEAAYNRIMNADMAQEQLEASKLAILQQTATAMLAQANQAPQSVLSLFR